MLDSHGVTTIKTNVFAITQKIGFTDQHFDDIHNDGGTKQCFGGADKKLPPIAVIKKDLSE